MKRLVLCWALVFVMGCFSVTALAAGESFLGTVEVKAETGVFAPIGGTVKTVNVVSGQRVSAGDILYTLETVKVYAEEAGAIHHVFGTEGDSIASLDKLHGGVLAMEPEADYTIAATTARAFDDDANRIIRVGETVYLESYGNGDNEGEGIVTEVKGAAFNVKVTSGTFELKETVTIYRDKAYTNESRLGRGAIEKTESYTVTGSGSIVKMHAKAGDQVKKGDLLFETLPGEFDGMVSTGSEVTAATGGIITKVNAAVGSKIQKGDAVIVLCEDANLWLAVSVPEADLAAIKPGDAVSIEFSWNEAQKAEGTVNWISAVSTVDAATAVTQYTAYVDFEKNADTRIGLNATVETVIP